MISHDGKVTVALDAATPEAAAPETLKINFNGKQDFNSQETRSLPLKLNNYGENSYARIERSEMQIPLDGRNCQCYITAHVNVFMKQKNASVNLGILQVAWADVNVAGKEQTVLVGADAMYADFPAPDAKNPLAAAVVLQNFAGGIPSINRVTLGQPMNVNGKWFTLGMADKGKKLVLTDYVGPMGMLDWPECMGAALLTKGSYNMRTNKIPSSIFSFNPGNVSGKTVTLPVGEYTLLGFALNLKGKDKAITLTVMPDYNSGKQEIINVTEGQIVKLYDSATKITITPDLNVVGNMVEMKAIAIKGIDNMRIDTSSLAEKISIYSASDNKLVHEGKLEYG
jgi:hypothetical protein